MPDCWPIALALTPTGGERLADARTGKNRQHLLVGLLRQSVFGRLASYERKSSLRAPLVHFTRRVPHCRPFDPPQALEFSLELL